MFMTNTKFNALICDTRSIQNYIYSGNLLRTNIGASYIVDRNFFWYFGKDADSSQDTIAAWNTMQSCKKFFAETFGELNIVADELNQADISVLYTELKKIKMIFSLPWMFLTPV